MQFPLFVSLCHTWSCQLSTLAVLDQSNLYAFAYSLKDCQSAVANALFNFLRQIKIKLSCSWSSAAPTADTAYRYVPHIDIDKNHFASLAFRTQLEFTWGLAWHGVATSRQFEAFVSWINFEMRIWRSICMQMPKLLLLLCFCGSYFLYLFMP